MVDRWPSGEINLWLAQLVRTTWWWWPRCSAASSYRTDTDRLAVVESRSAFEVRRSCIRDVRNETHAPSSVHRREVIVPSRFSTLLITS